MKQPFSDDLQQWLKRPGVKTIAALEQEFAEKSFALSIMLLMFLPALPIPTGGVTHIFEAITMVLALEMVFGRKTIWLPKKWRELPLGPVMEGKALPYIIRRIRWFEKYSRRRAGLLMSSRHFIRFIGVLLFGFALAAALAVPFSGLDTLPALGAVVVSLSIILEDALLLVVGSIIGAGGIVLMVGIGDVILRTVHRLL